MTLDGTIAHAKEVAKEIKAKTKACGNNSMLKSTKKYVEDCLDCASEYEQLAAWLTELQERREAVKKLEESADNYKDSLFGDGIRFALKVIGEPRKRDWEREDK